MKASPESNPEDTRADGEGLFPIRTVATLTRVNPVTLRAWERRYGLVRPRRTPKGHRLYTRQDIDLINRIVDLLGEGIAISRVPQALEGAAHAVSPQSDSDAEGWDRQVERLLEAVGRFSEPAVNAVYNKALSLYPVGIVTQRLVMPVLVRLGERWQREESGVAEEHFFGTFLRNKLGARFHHMVERNHGSLLVTACLPGERHEIGLMLFSLAVAERGYRIAQLGPDMPLSELPVAVRHAGAAALVLSGSLDPSASLLQVDLPALVVRAKVPVFVGGGVAVGYHDALRRAGVQSLGVDLDAGVRLLEQALTQAPDGGTPAI